MEGEIGAPTVAYSELVTSAPSYLRVKRIVDVVVCLLILLPVLIVATLCTLAILFDSWGPVFFIQERTGRNGRRFAMFKFRTMVPDAEVLKPSLRAHSIVPAPDFKVMNDPRVTRVGRWLRKTGLDELPQLLNVLRGEMSLVGPRPTSFETSSYQPWHLHRLDVPPGITGLWQVEGRNSVDFDDRVRCDLEYIRRMSLAEDVKIMFRTIGALFRREGC